MHDARSSSPLPPAWTPASLQAPHDQADKPRRVRDMFAAIAAAYDRNNRLHSLWRDQAWRRAAVALARIQPTDMALDVACGTGDVSMLLARAGCAGVIGVDFTPEMLAIAGDKAHSVCRADPGLKPPACVSPTFAAGDALRLPVADASVNVVTIAFGIRNVADPRKCLDEFFRVLRPGGRAVILEFSEPAFAPLRGLYHLYSRRIMPWTATWIAGDRSGAYHYLPRSVATYMAPDAMAQLLRQAGFGDVQVRRLSCGIATLYRGVKAG